MPSLLVAVFVLQVAIHLVNTLGAATINSFLWRLYNCIPTPNSNGMAEQRQNQAKFLRIRKEMNATSSQDEFAKWAKLRREHDRVLEQLEKSKSSTESTKAMFDRVVSILRWLGTNGLRMFLQFWYSRQAIFWLPQSWVPYYAEWLLSLPRAPLGSISIQAWSLACGAIILLASDALVASVTLLTGTGMAGRKEAPMKATSEEAKNPMSSHERKEM